MQAKEDENVQRENIFHFSRKRKRNKKVFMLGSMCHKDRKSILRIFCKYDILILIKRGYSYLISSVLFTLKREIFIESKL